MQVFPRVKFPGSDLGTMHVADQGSGPVAGQAMGCSCERVSCAETSTRRQCLTTDCSELVVKVVNTSDMERVFYLRDHPKPAKHVSFDYNTSSPSLTVSCSDGMIYVYSFAEQQPELVKKITATRGRFRMLMH